MSELVDPHDFIITRKRKKYRFAKFHNAPNCSEFDDWLHRPIDVVEVGAGTALFSVELAARHPSLTFLALDVKADRLQKGAYEALERGLTNVWFVRARADQLAQVVGPKSLKSLWVTFPDPFPKKRSAGRRLTHPTFLTMYGSLLEPSGSLYLKHDNPEFFTWSLEQLVQEGWQVDELSFDLHESSLDEDYKIQTRYERRWLSEGLVTQFVSASKPRTSRTIQK
ncbi:MAG: tRNA (guanosine(46)-N7)-methyltransferase TrmB [Candidatus Saccharimonas sp.]